MLKAAEDLVQIAIAGLAIDVLSEVPLSPGQNLQLAVSQTLDGTIRLAVAGEGTALGATALSAGRATAPLNDPLTPLERIAVSVATENAATQQQGLAPLFANLSAVAALDGFPPAVGQAVAQVLAQQTGLDQNLTGDDVQNALAKSGLFLEASLAAGVLPPDRGPPDLKAALIVLRQTLTAAIATGEGETALATSAPPAAAAAQSKDGSVQTAQSTTSPTSTQFPGIGNREVRLGTASNFPLAEVLLGAELRFATPQGTAVAQFEIARDSGGNEVEAAKRVWRARFSLNLEPAGPVHALVALSGERTSVRMWAERAQTAAQLRTGAAELNQALAKAELVPGDIVIREGTPPSTAPTKVGHFLNRAL